MAARIIAIALLVMTLAIALALMAIVFVGPREGAGPALRPDEQPTGGTPIEHMFSGNLGQWRLEGELAIVSTGAYQLVLRFSNEAGQPASTSNALSVQVDMVDHSMEPKLPQVELEEPGVYRATGTLEMEGRWRFRIGLEDAAIGVLADFRR